VASIAPELRPLANAYTDKAINLSNQQYTPYSGTRYADFNPTQQMGMGMIQNRALSGDQLQNTGYNYLGNMLTSGPQQATRNPYGNISAGQNNSRVTAQSNPYAGTNKFLNQNIDASLGDVARNFNQNVRPAQVGANVASGSFGNSGLAEVQAMQENDLQRQMGNIASGMRMQDYQNQQQLAESAIDRNFGAQQFNAGLTENNLGRSMQAQQFNAGMGQDWAGRNDAMYQNWMGGNMNALGMVPNFSNAAYQDAAQLMNVGNMRQDQSQQNMDFKYQQFMDKQNLPYQQLAAMAGVFGSQPFGSSSSQTTQSSGGGGK
jgi:hypothetical protein